MSTIKEIQDEIISEFEILGDDKESTIFYIMELGGNLKPFPETERKEENIIKGCQSKVWLVAEEKDGKVHYQADSNTDITKVIYNSAENIPAVGSGRHRSIVS